MYYSGHIGLVQACSSIPMHEEELTKL